MIDGEPPTEAQLAQVQSAFGSTWYAAPSSDLSGIARAAATVLADPQAVLLLLDDLASSVSGSRAVTQTSSGYTITGSLSSTQAAVAEPLSELFPNAEGRTLTTTTYDATVTSSGSSAAKVSVVLGSSIAPSGTFTAVISHNQASVSVPPDAVALTRRELGHFHSLNFGLNWLDGPY